MSDQILAGKMSHPLRRSITLSILVIGLHYQLAGTLQAEETQPPLHQKINQLLNSETRAASLADDSTFLRRIYLDLLGRIPSATETRSFLSDNAPDKKAKLIDDLLSRDEVYRHLATSFDLMFMERRGGKHVNTDEFRNYLEQSFRDGKTYLEITREILAADGTEAKNRAASAFYLERDVTPDLLTREIGRVFFGVDLQCAQCHNHPNIEDYQQEDYYGLQAFIVRASLFQPDKKKPALIAEKAEGEAAFQSVFTDRSSMTGPRVLDGEELIEVSFKPGERYQVAPAKNVRHVPKQSRIEKLAEVTTSKPTNAFNRNIANRLWAQMLGRGLVTPVDLHHSNNPPSHPELLQMLADDFAARNYDVKSFLREIALSEVYQRDSIAELPTVEIEATKAEIERLRKEAEAEVELSYQADEVVSSVVDEIDAAFAELQPKQAEVAKAEKAAADALKARDDAQSKLTAATKATRSKRDQVEILRIAHEKGTSAAEALKDDKEIASALAIFKKKFDGASAELKKLEEAENQQSAATQSANTALQKTYATIDTATKAALPFETKVRETRAKLLAKRKIAEQHREQAALLTRQAEQQQQFLDYSQLVVTAEHLQQRIPQQQAELTRLQAALPSLKQEVADKQMVLTAGQEKLATLQQELQRKEKRLKDKKETLALLQDSLTNLSKAAAQLEDENALNSAKSEIEKTIQGVSENVNAAQTALQGAIELTTTQTKQLATWNTELEALQNKATEHQKKITNASAMLVQQKNDLQQALESRTQLAEQLQGQLADRLLMGRVSPLGAEQLAWSILIATGQAERQRAAEAAKLNKEKPLSAEDQKNQEKVTAREAAIDAATHATLFKQVKSFLPLFAAGVGQPQHDFFATADQALYLANGNDLRTWLAPVSGNLTDRLNKLDDVNKLTEELYLTVLCRFPVDSEIKMVDEYLKARNDQRAEAIQELAWALLTSAEFRFQY